MNKYSVSLMALAICVSSMTAAQAQSTATEPAQEQAQQQAQPATDEAAKQDAPAPEAEAARQDPEPVREEAPEAETEPAKSDAAAAPEPVKEEEAKPARKKKKKKAKKEKAEEQQPTTEQAAPESEAEPEKQEAAPAPETEPEKQEAASEPASEEQAKPAKKEKNKKKAKKQKAEEEQPAKQEAAPAPETDPAKQEAAPAPETEPAKQEAAPAPQATDPAKNTAQPQSEEPAQQQAQSEEDPKPEMTVKSVLRDKRAAADLTDAELRQRIKAAGELAEGDKAKPKQKERLKAKVAADTAELNARIAAATGVTVEPGAADAEAEKITADNRPAAELGDKELRQRIKQTRGLLATEGLSDASKKQLRAGLDKDRAEIRQRVAAKRKTEKQAAADPDDSGKQDTLPEANPGRMTVGDLLGDTRPADDLTTSALERRIDANRRALTLQNLAPDERKQIRARLKDDRTALRQRLVERRKRRKNRLSTGEAIAIGAGVGLVAGVLIASRPTITAAEAYDEELEDWLVSPPLVKVEPRYRIEDFAEQPRLRYSVPGIEVDTIRFGFGEGFLRTEEVPKLDRIGAIIERIVAGNPDEVFLIEGHTDAVGSSAANLALSTERAEAVKQALLEYFEIGENNLSTVGRGEAYLKIATQEAEAENRRVTLRRVTPLLAQRN